MVTFDICGLKSESVIAPPKMKSGPQAPWEKKT